LKAKTLAYAEHDGKQLLLDIYEPEVKSDRATILYIYGGGFSYGSRTDDNNRLIYQIFTDKGYRVVTIDYRLGMEGVQYRGKTPGFIRSFGKAVAMAAEDASLAIRFLIDNGRNYGIDPDNMILCGSSAGAITALVTEWHITNGKTGILPEDFNFRGVISFSGAIFSNKGRVRFNKAPSCPILLVHGTADKTVNYRQTKIFCIHFAGSDYLAKELSRVGANYNILRFKDRRHEICRPMEYEAEAVFDFIERNIVKGEKRIVDAVVDNPAIPVPDWGQDGFKSYY